MPCVVEAQVGFLSEREDRIREERQPPVHQDLVLEHPLVPDVHAGIAIRRPGERGAEMKGQRPGEGYRDDAVTDQDGQV